MFWRKKRKKLKPPNLADRVVPHVEYREVHNSPKIEGFGNFGKICGFDLTNCPYTLKGESKIPILEGNNWLRIMDECRKLDSLSKPKVSSCKNLPDSFTASYEGSVDVSLIFQPPTPTGRSPKYPVKVVVDNPPSYVEPVDWDAWIDAYALGECDSNGLKADHSSFVAYLYFLSSGEVGKADFIVWENERGYAFHFRAPNGIMKLEKLKTKHITDAKWTTL